MGTKRIIDIPPIVEPSLSKLLAELPYGKRVGQAVYVHREVLRHGDARLFQWVEALGDAAGVGPDFNVVKFVVSAKRLSFLSYPDFFENPHPILKAFVNIHWETGIASRQDYDSSANTPILHRKETLVEPSHAQYAEWKALTEAEERYGLYDEPHRIGFRKSWERRLAEKGLRYQDHRLVSVQEGSAESMPPAEGNTDPRVPVHRHKTALVRYNLSKPIQCLMIHGLLSDKQTLLDYGCGRGDDVRYLKAMGYRTAGWDPVYCPHGPRQPADIVNLGYVLNVIEHSSERIEVLQDAYALAQQLLVVAVLTAGSKSAVSGRPYGDGILTKRNTFQKYFRQQEIGDFLEGTLKVTAVPVSLGVFYVFKNPQDHQEFLARRSRRVFVSAALDWESVFKHPGFDGRIAITPRRRKESLYMENRELLEAFWHRTLELGRLLLPSEFDRYGTIENRFGSAKKALRLLIELFGSEALDKAAESRRNDLLVYVALSNFRRRVPFECLPEALQADIRFFFGSYPKALAQGLEILFAAGNPDSVARCCEQTPFGYQDDQALYIHSSLVSALHPILRVYIGCAEFLCGEVREADIVKIHKRSGKLSLLTYDDFFGKPFPELHTRVKVNLRNRDIDIFNHRSDVKQELLFFKERYVALDHPDRERWAAESRALQKLGLELAKGYGPSKQYLLRLSGHLPWLGKMLANSGDGFACTSPVKNTGFETQK